MPDNIQEAVSLTKWLRFSAPTTKRSLVYFLALGVIFGGLAGVIEQLSFESFLMGVGSGITLIALPAILSAAVCSQKKEMNLKSALFLSLLTATIYAFFFLAAKFINWNLLFIGNGIILAIELWVSIVFFRLKKSSVIFASLHPTFNILFAIADKSVQLLSITTPEVMVYKLVFSSFVFITVVYALIWIISAPIKRNFGVSGLTALIYFISQWFYKRNDLEELFEEVGETVETLIGALVIEGKQRFAFFIPCVHFGPFGDLGGSDLPARVCDALPNSIVLHGTVTHDMNPVSRQEASKVVSTCKELFDSPVENKNFYFTKGEHGFAHSIALQFDGKKKEGLFLLSRAPKTTEDIHFGLGMAIRNLVMQKLDEAIIVDAHNAETGEFTTFEPSSVEGFEYIDAVADSLKEKKADGCYFGFAKTEFNDDSLGGAGIRAAVFGNEREKFGLIVFDSNGVEPSLRETLVSHVKTKLGIDCEILTTDQHKSNVVGGVRNPISGEGVVEVAVECLAQAIKNMGKVKVGLMVKRIKIKAFGPRNSITVIGTVNSIVAILKILTPFILLFALALALFGVMIH